VTGKNVLLESDIDSSPLDGLQIGTIGYGSQGSAQVLNLRDSGFSPLVGVRSGPSFDRAASDGVGPVSVEEAAARSDVIMVLTPDETQPDVIATRILPHAGPEALFGFATGFNVHFGLIRIPSARRTFMVAPKGPGAVLRGRFREGGGIPALVASLHDDCSEMDVALAYAKAIGCARVGVIKTTFREEAIADLFGEQCVLAGGMVELMRAAFEILVGRGYAPEVAYIECIREVEYMASLISRVGLAALGESISSTAFYGGATRGPRLVDRAVRQKLAEVLDEIENGTFAREFKDFVASGGKAALARPEAGLLERARSSLEAGS
jgi:ketol-acid reductoisomerase